jgi:hypothetical protein
MRDRGSSAVLAALRGAPLMPHTFRVLPVAGLQVCAGCADLRLCGSRPSVRRALDTLELGGRSHHATCFSPAEVVSAYGSLRRCRQSFEGTTPAGPRRSRRTSARLTTRALTPRPAHSITQRGARRPRRPRGPRVVSPPGASRRCATAPPHHGAPAARITQEATGHMIGGADRMTDAPRHGGAWHGGAPGNPRAPFASPRAGA